MMTLNWKFPCDMPRCWPAISKDGDLFFFFFLHDSSDDYGKLIYSN